MIVTRAITPCMKVRSFNRLESQWARHDTFKSGRHGSCCCCGCCCLFLFEGAAAVVLVVVVDGVLAIGGVDGVVGVAFLEAAAAPNSVEQPVSWLLLALFK